MRWAVVTGASSGIGLEFAHQLAERGYSVLMVSNQDNELVEWAEKSMNSTASPQSPTGST